jgi:hypothetical protein
MLYDDSEQLEVRHVISLAHYETDIYGGGEKIPEGELFVKRNCIRMRPRSSSDALKADNRPFYLFSNSCSEKEDFYHVMLQNQGRDGGPVPVPLAFNKEDMVKLIRQLHASEDNLQTRWLNALIGRVFLSLYKTSAIEQLVRKKISNKLSRVAKPAMITAIQLRGVHLGDGAPLITAPKLKELTRDGDLTLEADVKYKGGIRVDIAIIARIDLGQRFKVREVELLLAVVCKSLEGHMFFRIKPPPSNRIWFTFESMPKMDLLLEPVVGSRQITYALILRAIESKLREVIKDTLVLPNWDDVQFADTQNRPVRGGLWEQDSSDALNAQLSTAPTPAQGGEAIQMQDDDFSTEVLEKLASTDPAESIRDGAMPNVPQPKIRRSSSVRTDDTSETAVSPSLLAHSQALKGMRPSTFASAAIPVVSHEQAVIDTAKEVNRPAEHDAASAMKSMSSRSQPSTPADSPVGSLQESSPLQRKPNGNGIDISKRSDPNLQSVNPKQLPILANRAPTSTGRDTSIKDAGGLSLPRESPDASRLSILHKRQTFASTAAAAKKWGLDFVTRHSPNSSVSTAENSSNRSREGRPNSSGSSTVFSSSSISTDGLGTKANPIGRGQPLPPPGQPLPTPRSNRAAWTTMLGRRTPNIDHSRLPEAGTAKSSSVDIPQTKRVVSDKSFAPSSPMGRTASVYSPSIEELSNGSSIPRAVKQASWHRRGSQENDDSQDQEELALRDSVLVIKAPDSLHDGSRNESTTIHGSRRESDTLLAGLHAVPQQLSTDVHPSNGGSRWAESDARLYDLPSSYASSASDSVHSEPVDSPLYLLPAHPLATSRSAPLLSHASAPATPPRDSLTTILPQGQHLHRRPRSRQSLIPTPVGSRRGSPVELDIRKR